MQSDFDAPGFDKSYAKRQAHGDWLDTMAILAPVEGGTIVDVGCGGGIYMKALAKLGASRVIGVEPSAQMRRNARTYLGADEKLSVQENFFVQEGSAADTGLPTASVDMVFSRAMVHHLDDPIDFIAEAIRILVPGGTLLIQDRALEDVKAAASPTHLRGYFFECFPKLFELERARRPIAGEMAAHIQSAGFSDVSFEHFWETRRTYQNHEEIRADLEARTGRSLLHALSDQQLAELINYVLERLPEQSPITERDRWTFWTGKKPR